MPSLTRPVGGVIALVELANELVRQGHRVQILHTPTAEAQLVSAAELDWVDVEPAIEHYFPEDLGPEVLPAADVLLYTTMLVATAMAPRSGAGGRRLIHALRTAGAVSGLPVLYYQGRGVFTPADEELTIRLPGPKICVGTELAAHLLETGVPTHDVVHIPNGVDHETFRIRDDIRTREPRVAMNFDPHPVKGSDAGLEAIEHLHRQLGIPATIFGSRLPRRALPAGLDLVESPRRPALVDIYNSSTVFLQPSRREGFGMCAVEAMACGCALVTTDNGGSADYAVDGDTALVCTGEPDAMVDAVGRLVTDDDLRMQIARRGSQFVDRFRWSTSARLLVALACERLPSLPKPEGATS